MFVFVNSTDLLFLFFVIYLFIYLSVCLSIYVRQSLTIIAVAGLESTTQTRMALNSQISPCLCVWSADIKCKLVALLNEEDPMNS